MKTLKITLNVVGWISAGLIVWAFYPLVLKGAALANKLHYAWP